MQSDSSSMGTVHRYTTRIGNDEITIEAGRLAEQAGGAVTVQLGQTLVFATATMSKGVREGIDFFPLSVDYEEKLYAAGRIPGSYFRREGRPTEQAILTSRVIDRTLRPLFPENMRNEVQVILTAFSHDQEHQVDMLGIIAASTAIMISNIPWNGPVGGARIGMVNGELVINPTIPEMENSVLDLRVAGTAEAVNMVECAAQEVDEETMLRALRLAHEAFQPAIALQNQMRAEIGKPKSEFIAAQANETLMNEVFEKTRSRVREILAQTTDKQTRNETIDAIRSELLLEYAERNKDITDPELLINPNRVKSAFEEVMYQEVRRRILDDGVRPDGRDYTTIRPLSAEVGIIPRVHGSGLFKRGQTQVLTVATLGTPRDAQEIETVSPEENKRYLHHYNFPPFSTGETSPLRGPKRREIGHGALAEAALRPMIPDEETFPYTIRLVSEVLSSNGSSSMGSVCGSTLALLDAGVPIKHPVAGIAMGLIKDGDKVAVLTDIQGLEDHMGDMDFKVAGTRLGVTALQMDIKITGVTREIMHAALEQARTAREFILDRMADTIAGARENLAEHAPRITSVSIDPEQIGLVIGKGGETIRGLSEEFEAQIDVEDDGTIRVYAANGELVEACIEQIEAMTREAEVGDRFNGKVVKTTTFGAFVELVKGTDGLLHISAVKPGERVDTVEDVLSQGDELDVTVVEVDRERGRIGLRRSDDPAIAGKSKEELASVGSGDRGPRRGGGDRGRGRDRGGRGERRGGDRERRRRD